MASTPQTSGFPVNVMPSVQLADPRLFSSGYDQLGAGLTRGVDMGARLQDIRLRPEAMALQKAQERRLLAQIAMEQELQPLRAAELRQGLREDVGSLSEPIYTEAPPPVPEPLYDDAGNFLRYEYPAQAPVQTGTRTIRKVRNWDGTLSNIVTETDERQKLAAAREELDIKRLREQSLADTRGLRAALDRERMESPNWKKVGYAVDENGHVVYTVQNTKTGETDNIKTNLTPAQSGLEAMVGRILGGAPATPAAQATASSGTRLKIPASPPSTLDTGLDEEAQKLVNAAVAAVSGKDAGPASAQDKFTVGQIYTDARGNRAKYLGNGKWQEIQ